MERSDGGVVIPGNFPVSADDPTKGNITPVLNAQQLTAAVLQLTAMAQELQSLAYSIAGSLRDVTAETAEMIESIGILVTMNAKGDLTDEQDEAIESLRSYVEARRELRAQMDAEAEANAVEGHPVLGRDEEGGGFAGEAPAE